MKDILINILGNNETITISPTSNIKELKNQINQKYSLNNNQYYLVDNTTSRLVPDNLKIDSGDHYNLYFKLNGGGIFDGGNPFKPIIAPIKGIWKAIVQLATSVSKVFLGIPKIFMWLIDFLKWFVLELLNPKYIIIDLAKSILAGARIIILIVIDGFSGLLRKLVNMVFGPVVGNFWGYVPDEDKSGTDKKGKKKCSGTKCVQQPDTKVPLPVLFGTIVLPPLGLFMELGLKGWMNILICAILTLVYYFPGLIYALIILYC